MLKKLISIFSTKKASGRATIVARDEHNISRKNISKNAVKVLYRLKKNGYAAYLVGGGVRDLLLEKEPKDFDIATDAKPEEIRNIFKNCRLIGRRFRLAHICFGREIIEVATFRAAGGDKVEGNSYKSVDGQLLRDNVYGNIEEDVFRRDFTVNALYYNIKDFSIVDYVGGISDLKNKVLRLIGAANVRYQEDPVRMLRAVRFAAKLNFDIHKTTEKPIAKMAYLLEKVSPARLFEEYIKLFLTGHGRASLELLQKYGLFAYLVPQLAYILYENEEAKEFISTALDATDKRYLQGKTVNPGYLLACMLWFPLCNRMHSDGSMELIDAANWVLAQLRRSMSIPKRASYDVKDIWSLQSKFEKLTARNVNQVYSSKKFRAAYDFFLFRAQQGDKKAKSNLSWWQRFVSSDEDAQNIMIQRLVPRRRRKK